MPISNISSGEPQAFGAPVAVQPKASPLVRQQSGDGITRVNDANGRQIGVKPLTAIDMFDLTDALGDKATNAALFKQAMVAASAVEIDRVAVARPTSLMTIRALITRLGFPGFLAVSEALVIASVTESVNEEAVKKLSRHPDFRDPLRLMKRFGLSEETAFGMSRSMRMAAFIVDGEDQGLQYDWKKRSWFKPS